MPSNAFVSDFVVIYGHVGFDVNTREGKVTRTLGGSAYYAAMAAAAHGADVRLVSVLGRDFPETALELKRLDTSASPRSAGPSAVFTQTYNEEDEVIAFSGKLNVCDALAPDLIPLEPTTPSAIFLATAPPQQQALALDWLRSREFTGLIAIDTALAYVSAFGDLLRRYDDQIETLFVNEAEYAALTQRPPSCATTVVKRGSQGASMFENGVWSHAPVPDAEYAKTVTGAGDVLAGAFLSAYVTGCSSADALVRSVSFA